MLAQKTITLCGKQVEMLYCAATETGYEQLVSGTGKDINVFLPTILERDADGLLEQNGDGRTHKSSMMK